MALVSTASAFSPTFTVFCILHFISGLVTCGIFLSVFIWGTSTLKMKAIIRENVWNFFNFPIGLENVGKKQRVICGCLYQLLFCCGASIIGIASYFIRSWRALQLVISIPVFFLIPIAWYDFSNDLHGCKCPIEKVHVKARTRISTLAYNSETVQTSASCNA